MNSQYLHPFISNDEAIEIIKDKIRTNTPFSFTRFGDGEIYMLNRNASDEFMRKNCGKWGYKYPDEINNFYDDANKVLINAFVKTDMVGIMDSKCSIVNILYSEHIWSIKKDLVRSWGVNPDELNICDHMLCRQKEFGSLEGFKNLIQGNDFHIITSHKDIMEKKQLNKKFGVNITYTQHSNNINFNNRNEMLKSFENIKEKIVIMGVALQKDYGVILRDNFGKITFDMGATMDAWSGIITRPWFNKGNKQDYLVI